MRKYLSKKKIAFLILLLAVGVLVIARRSSYYETREYYAINIAESKYNLTNQNEQEIRQYFVAKQSELENVYLRFDIENLVNLKGDISVAIEDRSGNHVVGRRMELSDLTQTETADWTEFSMMAVLEKGEVYSLVIQTENVQTDVDGTCNLYLSRNRSLLFGNLDLSGTQSPKRLEATFKYNTYCSDDIVKMFVLLILSGFFIIFSGNDRLHERFCKNLSFK